MHVVVPNSLNRNWAKIFELRNPSAYSKMVVPENERVG